MNGLSKVLTWRLEVSGVYFQNLFQLQNALVKSISITFVNYFGQVSQNTKYKILLTKVIEIQNTFRVIASQSVNQSINQYSFNKQEKHKHISRLAIGTATVTVKCTVIKKKH